MDNENMDIILVRLDHDTINKGVNTLLKENVTVVGIDEQGIDFEIDIPFLIKPYIIQHLKFLEPTHNLSTLRLSAYYSFKDNTYMIGFFVESNKNKDEFTVALVTDSFRTTKIEQLLYDAYNDFLKEYERSQRNEVK